VTAGDIRLKWHGRGVTPRDPDSSPITMLCVYTVDHHIFMLQAPMLGLGLGVGLWLGLVGFLVWESGGKRDWWTDMSDLESGSSISVL